MCPEPQPRVLVVEDDAQLSQYLQTTLRSHGFQVTETATWEGGKELAIRLAPEVILLDLGLPDGDGLSLARELRALSRVPIIVVSARGREEDKVLALDMGADDYITKPFGSAELLARIRVALRHSADRSAPAPAVMEAGGLRMNISSREVTLDGKPVRLTKNEFDLLAVLLRHAGQVLTHGQLLQEVWGEGSLAHATYVRVYMRSLRKKLEADPTRPRLLLTELGIGYRLKSDP
ncbi:MAG: response regulator transcription factor [Holophaga sp.]|nr:response regulator transcription factor [Holophaga sp.]